MVATTRTKSGKLPEKMEAAINTVVVAAPKKRTAKANTSKPRDKKIAAGRMNKKKAATAVLKTKTVRKEKTLATKAKDKVGGKAKKTEGTVEGEPAKKVCETWFSFLFKSGFVGRRSKKAFFRLG